MSLYPTFAAPSLAEEQRASQRKPIFRKAPRFDFDLGDFALDGRGRVATADGYTAWAQWCVKTVLTERYSALVYSRRYGTELEAAMRMAGHDATELALRRAVTEALLTDGRTKSVKDFAFSWNGDQLSISCTIVPTVGTSQKLEVSISG